MLDETDLRQLSERDISPEEARRQLEVLRRPPGFVTLVRPCTVGDGIVRVTDAEVPRLSKLHDEAASAGRFVKFVPASGAASRMFKSLLFFQRGDGREWSWNEVRKRAEGGETSASDLVEFCEQLRRFAFHDDLKTALDVKGEDLDGLARAGAFQPVLDAFLGDAGLDYDALPKGLLKFHGYPEGSRTSFEEHLVEATQYVRDADGTSRLHFTVSPEHRRLFERRFREVGSIYSSRHETRYEIAYSTQKPSTDTLAVDAAGEPFRDEHHRLMFRPGGHGALIENLNDLGADLVFIKNIDNVQPDRLRGPTLAWKRVLGGLLADLAQRVSTLIRELNRSDPPERVLDEAESLARSLNPESLEGDGPPTYQARRAGVIRRLNRPIRVCGVVPNTGEPGGGPFWVRGTDGGASLQIVESAQIDPDDPEARRVFRSSTHFNPVDLVCAVRDANGEPHDLLKFVDPDTAIVTAKSSGGLELRALERPGLWNGAMARWNTVFVEVPIETFSPVKTVVDLLRDVHQPAR